MEWPNVEIVMDSKLASPVSKLVINGMDFTHWTKAISLEGSVDGMTTVTVTFIGSVNKAKKDAQT